MNQKSMKTFVGTKLSPKEMERIQFLVEGGFYLNVSDFVREAIREKLQEIRVLELRDLDLKTAEKEIIDYLKKRKGEDVYPSEIIEDLSIEVETVFRVLEKFRKERIISEAK